MDTVFEGFDSWMNRTNVSDIPNKCAAVYRSAMTNNHEYNIPEPGSVNWAKPLNENFEKIDTDVEVRDTDANKAQYAPKTGAKYFATDTGAVYLGDGKNWNKIASSGTRPSVEFLKAQSATIGDVAKHASNATLEVLGSERGQGLILQNQTDSVATGRGRANVTWVTHGDATPMGQFIASMTAHPADNHFSVYTRVNPIGEGSGDLTKRLDIEGGAESTTTRWTNNSKFTINNANGNAHLMVRGVDSTDLDLRPVSPSGQAGIHFRNGGSREWRLFRDPSVQALRLYNYRTSSEAFTVDTKDNAIDLQKNASKNVVWNSGSARPNSPATGQRFFDTSLGRPIWYDGSAWVDAQGSQV